MPVITDTILRPDGTPDGNAHVDFDLVGADPDIGWIDATSSSAIGKARVRTNRSGVWTVDLLANATIAPADTVWRARVFPSSGLGETYYLSVPSGGGPYWAFELLTTAPDGTTVVGTVGGTYSSALSVIVHSSVTGDAYDELQILADGSILTGDGTVAPIDRFAGLRWDGRVDMTKATPAVMASPPTMGGAIAGNPATSISGGVLISAIASAVPNTAYFAFRGGLWHRKGASFPDSQYASAYVPSGNQDPAYSAAVEFDYYGAAFEFGYKGQGTLDSRVWIDGQPAEAVYSAVQTQDGAYHLRKVTFAGAGLHQVRIELAVGNFFGLYVGPTDLVRPAAENAEKLLVIHDSYGEGTGGNRFDGYAFQVARMLGFPEIINLSEGGTGVVTANPSPVRPKYAGRSADWSGLGATAVLLGMSVNDGPSSAASVATELETLLPTIKSIPGVRDVWVIGLSAQGGGAVATSVAREAIISPVVVAHGIPYVSLLTPNPLWTGTGSVEAPTGSGTSDVMYHSSGGLQGHPTVAGHAIIAQAFVERLKPYLAVAH